MRKNQPIARNYAYTLGLNTGTGRSVDGANPFLRNTGNWLQYESGLAAGRAQRAKRLQALQAQHDRQQA